MPNIKTMKKTFLLLSLALIGISTNAQTFDWAKMQSGTGFISVRGIASDALGNTIIAGGVYGEVDINPGVQVTNITSGSNAFNAFMAKYNSSGALVWSFTISNTNDETFTDIAIGDNGDIYACGNFVSPDMDPSANDASVFGSQVCKYASDGSFLWTHRTAGTVGIDFDHDRQVVKVTGTFNAWPFNFGTASNPFTLASQVAQDVFIATYDADLGDLVNAIQIGDRPTPDVEYVSEIVIDQNTGSYYVVGNYYGAPDFAPGPVVDTAYSPNGMGAIYIAKYDSLDQLAWVKRILDGPVGFSKQFTDIIVDNDGNFFVTGGVSSNIDLDFSSGNTALVNQNFIAKYNTSGDFLWGKGDVITLNGDGIPNQLAFNPNTNSIYWMGTFTGTPDFDFSNNVQNLTGNYFYNTFICEYNASNSDFIAAHKIDSANSGAIIYNSNTNKIIFNNSLWGNADYDWNSGSQMLDNSAPIFSNILVQYSGPPVCNVDANITLTGNTISAIATGVDYQWLDCNTGNPINNAISQSFTPTSNGIYAVIITDGSCVDTSTCITIILGPSGINEFESNTIAIYPNPNTDYLIVKLDSWNENSFIEIDDITGKFVRSANIRQTETTIPVSDLSNGIYLIKVTNGNIITTKRFIKQ